MVRNSAISTTFGFDQYETELRQKHSELQNLQLHATGIESRQPHLCARPALAGLRRHQPGRAISAPLSAAPAAIFSTRPAAARRPPFFSVAKYVTANGAPNFNDVVFAFTTLDRNNTQTGNFNVNLTQNGANLFGIKSNRVYNVKKHRRLHRPSMATAGTSGSGAAGIAGSNVLANGPCSSRSTPCPRRMAAGPPIRSRPSI